MPLTPEEVEILKGLDIEERRSEIQVDDHITITITTEKWTVRFSKNGMENCLIETQPCKNGKEIILNSISENLNCREV